MTRYIDADALLEEIRKAQISLETNNDALWNINQKYYKGLAWAHRLILDAPTADVAEVKHSDWILHNDGSGICKRCNTTQKLIWDWDGWQHYCGHCGAKMDGKGD